MQVRAEHPSHDEELQILELDNSRQTVAPEPPTTVLSKDDLLAMRAAASVHYLDPKLNRYIVDLVQATRNPGAYSEDLARWIRYGASPRASIALARCARALAWMRGDDYVSPEHIQQVAPEVLRHRLLLTFEAEAEAITTDDFIQNLLELVAIP
jgi:MoxR-like ATPase